jgi:hypothetical protein
MNRLLPNLCIMKSTLIKIAVAGSAFASLAVALPAVAADAPNWDATGSYTWLVLGTYEHDLTITNQNADGTFTGTGGYPAGGPYLTTESITGQVSGDLITFATTYDGPYNPGYTAVVTGTIAPDGTMSGTSPWEWHTTTGTADPIEPVDDDSDNDGVVDGDNVCEDTSADADWSVSWGTNRWEVRDNEGVLTWFQNKVGKKGVLTPTAGETIAYTYGCNGHQILALLNEEFGSVMNGHLKYGLSSGLLDEFNKDLNDGVLDGQYYLETVTVPANDVDGVSSLTTLLAGKQYALKASGTANAGDGIEFDVDYSYRTPTSVAWTDAVSTYEYLGDTLLDLKVNGGFVNWDDDAVYNADHTYWYELTGTGAPVTFLIDDAYYPNNTGNLTVDIYATI